MTTEVTRLLNEAERILMQALKLMERDTKAYDEANMAIDYVRWAHDDLEPEAECTCRPRAVRPTDIEPPPVVRDRDCPIHGIDPDAARDKMLDDRRGA